MLASIVFLFLIVSSVNIWVLDLKYAHKSSNQNSFDWVSYNTEIAFRKFVRSIVDDGSIGLPQIHLYIGLQALCGFVVRIFH